MKCSKCGAELSEDTKFCSYCGNKVEAMITETIEEDTKVHTFSQDESAEGDTVIPPFLQDEHIKENANEANVPKSLFDKLKEKIIEFWNSLSMYGKAVTVSVSVFIILCLVALLFGKITAAAIAFIQIILVIVSVLIHMEIIKPEQTQFLIKYLTLIIAILLTVPNIMSYSKAVYTSKAYREPYEIGQNIPTINETENSTANSETSSEINDESETSAADNLDNNKSSENEIIMPNSAYHYEYKNYQDVQNELSNIGFTNISFEILYDIYWGVTEEGEVDSVSINSNLNFEKGDIFSKDVPIIITYHMKEEDNPNKQTESETTSSSDSEAYKTTEKVDTLVVNLTADNCSDLAALLALDDPYDPSVSTFASKYSGRIIEFDGCVASMQKHGSYSTRWDVLLGAGNFDENSMRGPNFHLTDVNFSDMNVTGGDSVYAGLNVHIVAKVSNYNSITSFFELDIISMGIRN